MNIRASEVGLIAQLSVSQWQGNTLDRYQGMQVADRNGASVGRVRVMKRLLDQSDIKPIRHAANDLRDCHKLMTLPWNNSGERLLPIRSIHAYQRGMDNRISKFNLCVEDFVRDYDTIKANAQNKLGSLYESHLFPSKDFVRDRFRAIYTLLPAPDASHLNGSLFSDPGILEAMKANVDTEVQQRVKSAMEEPFRNIGEAMSQLAAKLKETDENGKPPIFHDSSLQKILDMVDVLPSLNITGDPALAAITDGLATALAGVTPKELRRRDKEAFNKQKADSITETINRLQRDYGPYFTRGTSE